MNLAADLNMPAVMVIGITMIICFVAESFFFVFIHNRIHPNKLEKSKEKAFGNKANNHRNPNHHHGRHI